MSDDEFMVDDDEEYDLVQNYLLPFSNSNDIL